MLKRVLSFLVVLLAMGSIAQAKVSLEPYFKNLDYFNENNRSALLKYEADFIQYMQKSLKKHLSELSPIDGKTLLYGTLFLSNSNQGVRFKQLSAETVMANGKLDMLERELLILDCLRLAEKLLPDDYRIPTWIGGHELYYEELTLGAVTDATFNKMFELSTKDQFSYTAFMIVTHDLKLSIPQEKKMLELAQMVSDRKIPCVKNDSGKCFDPKIAPQTKEVGRLLTGDIFLRDAGRVLEADKVDEAGLRMGSGVSARVIYGIVKQGKFPNLKGLDWSNIYIKGRVKAVNQLLWKNKAVDHTLTDSLNFNKAYSCVACHGSK
jgi:hypothetical protein